MNLHNKEDDSNKRKNEEKNKENNTNNEMKELYKHHY